MKLLLDENIPINYGEELKKRGNDIKHIKKTNESIKDSEIYKIALKEKRFIVTRDSDFNVYIDMKNYGILKISGFVDKELTKIINILSNYKNDVKKNPGITYIMYNNYYYQIIPKFSKKGIRKRPHKLKMKFTI